MSKVHVLTGMSGRYTAVLHAPIPSGNNAVGVSWKACLLSSGTPVSALPIGMGYGQITQVEASQIAVGDVLEYQWEIPTNADGSAPTTTFINSLADQEIIARNLKSAVEYKYFGYTQG